ncbi:hypothetical protein BDD12DRAFT_803914 [Trichophaea hybrida]|nr:hypothetical protein BDD12DRAFT_803914 [Trichophaea hybrida]
MAEIISVAASVTGMLAVAERVATIFYKFGQRVAHARTFSRNVMTEIHDISRLLRQLDCLIKLQGKRTGAEERLSLIMVNHVLAILTSCVLTFSELEALVNGFGVEESTFSFIGREKWAQKEKEIGDLFQRLQNQKISLSLMLNIIHYGYNRLSTPLGFQHSPLVKLQVSRTPQAFGNWDLGSPNIVTAIPKAYGPCDHFLRSLSSHLIQCFKIQGYIYGLMVGSLSISSPQKITTSHSHLLNSEETSMNNIALQMLKDRGFQLAHTKPYYCMMNGSALRIENRRNSVD